jgi:hypothetical protein
MSENSFFDTKECSEMRACFENINKIGPCDREDRSMFLRRARAYYKNGEINREFLSFMDGYMLGKRIGSEASHE